MGKRCAIHLPSLPVQPSVGLAALKQLGFLVEDVSLVALARAHVGRGAYKRGAPIDKAPWIVDCSSLVKWLYAQRGIWLPRRSVQQWSYGVAIEQCDVQAGDLVFTKGYRPYQHSDGTSIGHVGIMTDVNRVVSASKVNNDRYEDGITEVSLTAFAQQRRICGFRRIIADPADVTTLIVPPNYDIEVEEDVRLLLNDMLKASVNDAAA